MGQVFEEIARWVERSRKVSEAYHRPIVRSCWQNLGDKGEKVVKCSCQNFTWGQGRKWVLGEYISCLQSHLLHNPFSCSLFYCTDLSFTWICQNTSSYRIFAQASPSPGITSSSSSRICICITHHTSLTQEHHPWLPLEDFFLSNVLLVLFTFIF